MQPNPTHPWLGTFQAHKKRNAEADIINTHLLLFYTQQELCNKTFKKIMEFIVQNKIILSKHKRI